MFYQLFYPRQALLVTASSSEKTNLTAVEWFMPVADKPSVVALSLANNSLTLDLICTSMEFVVAVPSEKLREAVILCGSTSGKYIDKFEETRLTQVRAKKVSAPLILEAVANLECKVLSYTNAGDHTIVVGEVVEAHPPKQDNETEPFLFSYGSKRLFGFKRD